MRLLLSPVGCHIYNISNSIKYVNFPSNKISSKLNKLLFNNNYVLIIPSKKADDLQILNQIPGFILKKAAWRFFLRSCNKMKVFQRSLHPGEWTKTASAQYTDFYGKTYQKREGDVVSKVVDVTLQKVGHLLREPLLCT